MAGDDDFSAFYEASCGPLVGQLLAITGNLQDAEDAVQEAFARASLRWMRLRDFDAPEAWVRRVAINLAVSGVRRARRQLAVLARVGPAAPLPAHSAEQLVLAEVDHDSASAQRPRHPASELTKRLGAMIGPPLGQCSIIQTG